MSKPQSDTSSSGLEINNEKFPEQWQQQNPTTWDTAADGDEFFEFGASLKRIFYGCAEQQEEAINRGHGISMRTNRLEEY